MQHKYFASGAVALLGVIATAPVLAQAVFEEIVITATKRERTLQEVPVAVSVTDAETIEQAQIFDVLDLQSVVPSLRVTQLQSSANTNFVIRGFGNGANNPGIEPSVGVFIDGVYRSRSAAALSDLPKLERVEVLRGPQSTLFGKNASAGVISVVTGLPEAEMAGSAELVVGKYGQVIVKGEVSGPLTDNVGFGLSASSNTRDGYFDNLEDGTEFNERDRWGVRGQLYVTPTDTISLRFIADYDEIDEQCCGVGNIIAGPTVPAVLATGGQLVLDAPFSYDAYINTIPSNQIENSGVSLQADFDFDAMTLTSISSFRTVNRIEDIDADFTSSDIVASNFSETDLDTITQELRLSSNQGEHADWLLGAFWFKEDVDYDTDLRFGADTRLYADILNNGPGALGALEAALGPFGVPPGSLFSEGSGVREITGQNNTALSLFGQVDWYVSDRATVTLGVNYTRDEKDAFVTQPENSDVFASLDFVQIGFLQILQQLEMMDPGNPANVPTAQALSMVPCTDPPSGPCNPLLAGQAFQVFPPFVDYPNSVENGKSDDSETTWTARIAFDATDNINIYASAATGFKATSWNLSRDSRPFASDIAALQSAGLTVVNLNSGTRSAGPEDSTVYELGLKARFDKGALNLAVFDQTIEGFQSNTFTGLAFSLTNAGKQSATGFEFDGTYYPNENWKLTLAGTWMDPEYDSFVGAAGVGGSVDLSGTKPAGIHELSMVGTATYTRDLDNGMSTFVRFEYLYDDKIAVVDNVPSPPATREVNTVNASAGLSLDSGWSFTLWGRNLTDDEYFLSAAPAPFQDGTFFGYPSAPTTYGLTIRKDF